MYSYSTVFTCTHLNEEKELSLHGGDVAVVHCGPRGQLINQCVRQPEVCVIKLFSIGEVTIKWYSFYEYISDIL